MKTYIFEVTRWPNSAFHQPFSARIVLSENAVVSGTATASDILSLTITAGASIPDGRPITFADLHSHFLNPTITLSADRKSIVGFSADRADGARYDFLVFFQSFPRPPNGRSENIIELRLNRMEVESNFVPPLPTEIHFSIFEGDWKQLELKAPSPFRADLQHLAVDPLSLLLSNEVYVRLNLPNPPPFEAVRESVRERIDKMSSKEREQVLSRIREWKTFAESFEKEFEKKRKK